MYVKLIKVSGTYSHILLCNQFVTIDTFALQLATTEQHNMYAFVRCNYLNFKDIFKRKKEFSSIILAIHIEPVYKFRINVLKINKLIITKIKYITIIQIQWY